MRIYELNTAVFLGGRRLEERATGSSWRDVDAVWLMGVWERSPAGLAIARADPELIGGMRAALPDLRDEDVIGSPYCVRDYVVDPRFGDLAAAREALAARGLKLILDYVPNHVAPDHPWVGVAAARVLRRDPTSWLSGRRVAPGRDPYFPPWPDVVQLNAFAPALRAAVRETLRAIAEQCDGVRCDMAMLMTNEVFARTWALEPPATEYWPEVMAGIRDDFTLIAEAYWDMEFALMQQGFDFCYDKRLYDRLAHEDAAAVRGHLQADLDYQRAARALHREPRRAARGDRVRPARPGGGGRDVDRAGRPALPRRPVRRAAHEDPGLPRARAGRAGRRGPARVLRAAGRAGDRRLAAGGRRRLAGQPTRAGSCWPGRSPAISRSSTSATRPRRAWSASPPGPAPTC